MKSHIAVGLVVFGLFSVAFAADKVSIADLLKDPAKFDGKEVAVQGIVEDYSEKVSGGGNAYVTLKCKEGEKRITVWMRGRSTTKAKNGDEVIATGVFAKERKVGDVVYKNEIDMTPKQGKAYGLQIVKAAGG
jgi:cytochrome c-type biogenesis protein CcmE